MTVVAVFCRIDHPDGYAMGGKQGKGAHGYVTLVVECLDFPQVKRVAKHLHDVGFEWPGRGGDGWYDGKFDLVFSREAELRTVNTAWLGPLPGMAGTNKAAPGDNKSLGDNRAVAYLDASHILVPSPAERLAKIFYEQFNDDDDDDEEWEEMSEQRRKLMARRAQRILDSGAVVLPS